MKVFVDSDVIISSLLSEKGAAYLLLKSDNITPIISNISRNEIEIVVERLNIDQSKLKKLLKQLKRINLPLTLDKVEKKFSQYVTVIYDAHIVAGAIEGRVTFLITYNIRHFKIDKIKEDLNIIVMTPGQFIQYLRSRE